MRNDVSSPSKLTRTNPMKPQPWPIKASQLAKDLISALNDIAMRSTSIGMQARTIDTMAAHAVCLVQTGETVEAIQMLQNIRSTTAVQHHSSATILGAAAMAAARLQAALVGKYDTN